MLEKTSFAVQKFSFPAFEGDDLASLKIINHPTSSTATSVTAASPANSSAASFTTPEFNFAVTRQEEKELQQERLSAKKQSFKIEPMVMEYRGLQQQEEQEYQQRVAQDVSQRLNSLEQEAQRRGYEEGKAQGQKEVFNQMRAAAEEKLTALTEMVNAILSYKMTLIHQQKNQICTLIKHLTRWVILRELKDDDQYLERLVEAAAVEIMQENDHINVRVRETDYAKLESILPVIQEKLPRVIFRPETDPSIIDQGVIVESENGIIDASLEEQLKAIDRVFATIEKK